MTSICGWVDSQLVTTLTQMDYTDQKARFNFGHYVNDEHTKLISQIASSESFDPAKRVELFKQWQNSYSKTHSKFHVSTLTH